MTKKAITGVVLLLVLAGGVFVILSSDANGVKRKRAEILELSKRGELSDADKKRMFEMLSGDQYREYKFSERERALILQAIRK